MKKIQERIKKLEVQAHYQLALGHVGRASILYARIENLQKQVKTCPYCNLDLNENSECENVLVCESLIPEQYR